MNQEDMRIVLTSGGTRIPIDSVRHIGNMSNGTTGSLIAETILKETDCELHFLTAKTAKSPFKFEFNWAEEKPETIEKEFDSFSMRDYYKKVQHRYKEIKYTTFDDYETEIKAECLSKPDVVILAAAVSDYGCVPINGKIRSNDDLTINLYPLNKIISKVKNWCPDSVLVGFKLLVGASKQELIHSAQCSVKTNNCDLVVANDWNDVTKGNHSIYLVSKDDVVEVKHDESDKYAHAKSILNKTLEIFNARFK